VDRARRGQVSCGGESADGGSLTPSTGTAGLTDDDEAPESPKLAVTMPGDLFLLGNHRCCAVMRVHAGCKTANKTAMIPPRKNSSAEFIVGDMTATG
jgi:hypothetical protein